MPRYLSLLTLTEQGLNAIQQSTERAAAFRALVHDAGGKVLSQYWSIGEVDGCVVFEAPEDETAASLLLSLDKAGNVRTRTLRVYDETEFARIVAASS